LIQRVRDIKLLWHGYQNSSREKLIKIKGHILERKKKELKQCIQEKICELETFITKCMHPALLKANMKIKIIIGKIIFKTSNTTIF
jgi:hypothetical protein